MRWQYTVVAIGMFNAGEALGVSLSFFGQRGWELVGMYDKGSPLAGWVGLAGAENGFMLFKRPVPTGTEPQGPWAELWDIERVAAAYNGATTTSPHP